MQPKLILGGIVGVAFITAGTVDMSQAKGGNGPAHPTKVRAKLQPTANNEVLDAEGHAMRFTLSHGKKMQDRFEARVEVPVGDVDPATLEDFKLFLNLKDGSSVTCTMDFEEIDIFGVAEWKVSISQRETDPIIQNRAGNCVYDINPTDPILPNVVAEDTATAMGLVPSGSVELTGTFMPIGGGNDAGNRGI